MNTSGITPNARVRGISTGRELVRPAPELPAKPHPSVGAFTDELARQIGGLN